MERVYHRYSAELKQRLVEEIEQGQLSGREAARDAQTSVTMVLQWLEEYGRFKPKRDVVEVVMKSEQDKIAALEQALAEAHLKLRAYDGLINQANQRFKTDIKKLWHDTARAGTGDDVAGVCRALGCSRDAYYKRRARGGATTGAAAVVLEAVDALRVEQPRMGTRTLQAQLATAGRHIGRDRLFTLLRSTGRLVQRKPRYTRTTYSHHGYAVAPNRLKTMPVTAPRQVVVSDITYLRLTHTFVYLFLVTDLFSRKIVGWHPRRDLSHHAAVIALQRAIDTLGDVHGVLHHSDRGSQPNTVATTTCSSSPPCACCRV